jgi:hypothetical protein
MFIIKQLINKSVYGTIGYISSQDDLNILEQYIIYNLSILKEFEKIIIATNYSDVDLFCNSNKELWVKYFPNCILIDSFKNRGHNFGTADLDNLIFNYCRENNIEWLCKSANDVIIQESILDKEIDEADFYYMNGIGYGGMIKYDFDFERIIAEDFYPQTNFYFINISKIDYLNDQKYLDETYNQIQNIPNYNGKIWEYINGWSCEDFLKQCIIRNNLKKEHLISQEYYFILLHIVKDNHIHDSSYKNIMIEDICHLQYPQNQIIKIC